MTQRTSSTSDIGVGVGVSLGAGIGMIVGLILGGGPGLAIGVGLGAGLGVVAGAVWDRPGRSPLAGRLGVYRARAIPGADRRLLESPTP